MLNPQVENRTTDETNKQMKVIKKHSKSRPASLCSPCLSHPVDQHCQWRLKRRRAKPRSQTRLPPRLPSLPPRTPANKHV